MFWRHRVRSDIWRSNLIIQSAEAGRQGRHGAKFTVLTLFLNLSTIWPYVQLFFRFDPFSTAIVFGGRVAHPTAKAFGGRTYLHRHARLV